MDEFRKEARSGLTQKYNWDYVTEQYLEVFQELSGKIVTSKMPVVQVNKKNGVLAEFPVARQVYAKKNPIE
jgi:hypothetical protein